MWWIPDWVIFPFELLGVGTIARSIFSSLATDAFKRRWIAGSAPPPAAPPAASPPASLPPQSPSPPEKLAGFIELVYAGVTWRWRWVDLRGDTVQNIQNQVSDPKPYCPRCDRLLVWSRGRVTTRSGTADVESLDCIATDCKFSLPLDGGLVKLALRLDGEIEREARRRLDPPTPNPGPTP